MPFVWIGVHVQVHFVIIIMNRTDNLGRTRSLRVLIDMIAYFSRELPSTYLPCTRRLQHSGCDERPAPSPWMASCGKLGGWRHRRQMIWRVWLLRLGRCTRPSQTALSMALSFLASSRMSA